MPSCPRCINGTLFYDRSARDWWCINCGYHGHGNGSTSGLLSDIKDDHDSRNSNNGKSELERKFGPQLTSISSTLTLDEEIAELRRKLRGFETQKKVLVNLMRHGIITRDYLIEELNQLERDREDHEKELKRISQIRDNWRSTLKVK